MRASGSSSGTVWVCLECIQFPWAETVRLRSPFLWRLALAHCVAALPRARPWSAQTDPLRGRRTASAALTPWLPPGQPCG